MLLFDEDLVPVVRLSLDLNGTERRVGFEDAVQGVEQRLLDQLTIQIAVVDEPVQQVGQATPVAPNSEGTGVNLFGRDATFCKQTKKMETIERESRAKSSCRIGKMRAKCLRK